MDAYVHGFLYSVHPDGPLANLLILLHKSLISLVGADTFKRAQWSLEVFSLVQQHGRDTLLTLSFRGPPPPPPHHCPVSVWSSAPLIPSGAPSPPAPLVSSSGYSCSSSSSMDSM